MLSNPPPSMRSSSALGKIACLLPQKRGGPLCGQGMAPQPMGIVRPHCLVLALKDTVLSRGTDPNGSQAVPDLSSVIEGKLIFTEQSPRRRAGLEKLGAVRAEDLGPPSPLST